MTRLIIADAHVGHTGPDAADMVQLVGRAVEAGFRELWVVEEEVAVALDQPDRHAAAPRPVPLEEHRLHRRGPELRHPDQVLKGIAEVDELAERVDWTGRQHDFAAGGRAFRVVHGDRVNLRDVQYRFWSAVSKSRPARAWARLLPGALAVAIVSHMEARLAATNRKYRYRKPIRDLERAARDAWAEGVDVLLWGHFHTGWATGNGDRLAMVVPAWMETRGCLAVADDGSWSWLSSTLEPQPIPRAPEADGGGA